MAEKENVKKETDIQESARLLSEAVKLVLANAKQDEWSNVNQPFTQKLEQKKSENVIKPSTQEDKKELIGFKTYTFLDSMFLNNEDKSIDGVPFGASILLSGLPNSGKSLCIEEIILQLANNDKKVCFTTSEEIFKAETPRFDLQARLKERAKILGLDWNKICENLFVLDSVAHAELRDWSKFVSELRLLIEKEKIDFVAIDSLSMLEDSRGQLKYRLGELVKYFQIHGITSIMISQRSLEESDSMALAGGISLSHIADILMVLDYKKAWSGDSSLKLDTGCKQGNIVYFFRILKNRMCKYRANYFGYTIDSNGLVHLIPKTVNGDQKTPQTTIK